MNADKGTYVTIITIVDMRLAALLEYRRVCPDKGAIILVMAAVES